MFLLPINMCRKEFEIGDNIEVFCYLDHERELVAIYINTILVTVNQFIASSSRSKRIGLFMDWGLGNAFIWFPFSGQRNKMMDGPMVCCLLLIWIEKR